MNTRCKRPTPGFTIIELLVVVVLAIILGSLVALTYSGVRAKDRNTGRQNSVDSLQSKLEEYYAQNSAYPTLAQLNTPSWRTQNLRTLSKNALHDPRWNASNKTCTESGQPVAATQPAANCYSYQVTAADGSACDNLKAMCAHYTLTTLLEGGDRYVKTSLN
ncbi:MAG TPA: hypothetical protein VLH84_00245 [Patescibacteria group bacterium]|nr:hypothetical protein [Patescibacteria group bacterium]